MRKLKNQVRYLTKGEEEDFRQGKVMDSPVLSPNIQIPDNGKEATKSDFVCHKADNLPWDEKFEIELERIKTCT